MLLNDANSMDELELWKEYEVDVLPPKDLRDKLETIPVCGLCGNTGMIETNAKTPYGVHCGVHKPCICPNGRKIKEKEAQKKLSSI